MTNAASDAHRDLSTEQWLTRLGYEWLYEPELKVSELKVGPQIRADGVNPTIVDAYAQRFLTGDAFPAIVGIGEVGGVAVVEGRHRVAMYEQVRELSIPAYVIMTSLNESQRQRLAGAANQRNGRRLTDAELIEIAKERVRKGESQAEICADLSLTVRVLQAAIGDERMQTRMNTLNPAGWRSIARGTLRRLNQIKSDPVLVAAAEFAAATRLPQSRATALVTTVNARRSDADGLKELAEWRKLWAASRGQKTASDPKTPLARTLQYGHSLMREDAGTVFAVAAESDRVDETRDLADALVEWASELRARCCG
jgi:hypothetical protein